MKINIRKLAPLIPYVAVLVGMYELKSVFVAMGLYHAGMLTVVLTQRKLQPVLSTRHTSPWLYLTAIIYASGGMLIFLTWPYLSPDSGAIANSLKDFGLTKLIFPYFAVYFCLVNAIMEELFWRGYLGSDSNQVEANDIYFAGYHALVLLAFASVFWAVPVIAACAFAAWLWRQLRKVSGGLAIPIVTHIVADISIILAVYFRLFA